MSYYQEIFLIIIFEKQRLKPRTNKMFDMLENESNSLIENKIIIELTSHQD